MFAGGARFHTAVVLLIQQLQSPVIFILGFSRCREFIVYLSCVYILRSIRWAYYVDLPVFLHLLQCLVYHMLSKMKRGSEIYIQGKIKSNNHDTGSYDTLCQVDNSSSDVIMYWTNIYMDTKKDNKVLRSNTHDIGRNHE